MTFQAGRLEDFFDVVIEGKAGSGGGGRQLGGIRGFIGGARDKDGGEEAAEGEGDESGVDIVHNHFWGGI
jgi:hypothetical protein